MSEAEKTTEQSNVSLSKLTGTVREWLEDTKIAQVVSSSDARELQIVAAIAAALRPDVPTAMVRTSDFERTGTDEAAEAASARIQQGLEWVRRRNVATVLVTTNAVAEMIMNTIIQSPDSPDEAEANPNIPITHYMFES